MNPYESLLQALDATDRFFLVPKQFLRDLSPKDAIFLSLLMNYFCQYLDSGLGEDGWVETTTRDLQIRSPGLDRKAIQRALSRLEKAGIVKTKIVRRRRWVKIRVSRLGQPARSWGQSWGHFVPKSPNSLMGGNTPLKGVYSLPSQKTEEEAATVHVKAVRPKLPIHCHECQSTDWTALGEKLRKALSRITTVPKTAKPGQWGAHIRAAHVTDGYPLSHVVKMLDWYCERLLVERDINTNDNPNAMPVCYSGEAFRKKFQKVVGAHARLTRSGGGEGEGRKMNVRMRVVRHGKAKYDQFGFER